MRLLSRNSQGYGRANARGAKQARSNELQDLMRRNKSHQVISVMKVISRQRKAARAEWPTHSLALSVGLEAETCMAKHRLWTCSRTSEI